MPEENQDHNDASPAPGQEPRGSPHDDDARTERKEELPCVIYNQRPLREVAEDSLKAAKTANEPPRIFQQGTLLTRVRIADEDVLMEPMNVDSFRGFLDRSATFLCKYSADGQERVSVKWPPVDLAKDIMSLPGWPEDVFPTLSRIARCPFFTASGKLVIEPGYHAESKIWYAPAQGLVVNPVSQAPTDAEIEDAKRWLLDELLGDFPFQEDADKANAVSFLLTPYVREMIQGPIPMGLLEAPAAGTGKGLLANVLTIPATGNFLETIPQRQSDDEWRKAITAKLLEMPTHILFDNLTGTLKSPALEAALTSEVWADRFLGESRMVRMKIRTIWLATGNNLQIAGDLYRRTVWIRIDAKMEHPEDRNPTAFRHHPILPWVKANRGKLIWAALTIIQAWINRGRQFGTETMGSYESWAATLGGILKMIGVTGFLTNLPRSRANADDELTQLANFVDAWKEKFQLEEQLINPLYEMVAEKDDLLPFVMEKETPHGRKVRLGRYLSKHRDRTVGDVQIVILPADSRSRCLRYRLREVKGNGTGQAANAGPKGASPRTKKGEGDEVDEPHHAERVILLPVDFGAVVEVCQDWWYNWGSETVTETDLFEPLHEAGAIMAESPEEHRWRCQELLPKLAGCRLGIYQIEKDGYFLDDNGDRRNCYRLRVADGETPPPTLAKHVFTAEDLDRLVADLPRCDIPRGEGG